jgi:hypothetical protein
MATTYNRRCALCGQLQVTEDREALLEQERFEWDESLVDDFIAGNRHLYVDTDPYGALQAARLAEAGLIAPELRWLIGAALERKQAAEPPDWTAFTAPAATSAMAPNRSGAAIVRGLLACAVCTVRTHEPLSATWVSRSPP